MASRTLTSATLAQGPRLPASVNAVKRTYRARTLAKLTTFCTESSVKVPVATGGPHAAPSVDTSIRYCPIAPLPPAGLGRYSNPATVASVFMSTVRTWGNGAAGLLHLLCQMEFGLPSRTFAPAPFSPAVSSLLTATVQPVRGSLAARRATCIEWSWRWPA